MSILADLPEEHRVAVFELIAAEHESYTTAWTYLHEMRLRGELPEWVAESNIGTNAEHDAHRAKTRPMYKALFGTISVGRAADFTGIDRTFL